MHMWTAMAAGGTSQRLNPAFATVASRERNVIFRSPFKKPRTKFSDDGVRHMDAVPYADTADRATYHLVAIYSTTAKRCRSPWLDADEKMSFAFEEEGEPESFES